MNRMISFKLADQVLGNLGKPGALRVFNSFLMCAFYVMFFHCRQLTENRLSRLSAGMFTGMPNLQTL